MVGNSEILGEGNISIFSINKFTADKYRRCVVRVKHRSTALSGFWLGFSLGDMDS